MNTASDSPLPLSSRNDRRLPALAGWCVHFYTALGLVCSAGIAVMIVRGGHDSFRWAFVLMLIGMVIDGTDGFFARAVRIKEIVPGFDGRRLDDIIDFLNYTFLPLLLIWRAEILPPGYEACLLVPLLASVFGFCQVAAKTVDGYFLGFPSYWNVVAFYLYLQHVFVAPLPGWLSAGLLVGLAVLTFVPSQYLYPTQRGLLNSLTYALGVAWGLLLIWLLYHWPSGEVDGLTRNLLFASLLFPAWYLAASWLVTWQLWQKRRERKR